jgi:hypothetical protein
MASRRTHEKTRRPASGRLVRSCWEDQADGLASGLVSGLVAGLEVSGLVTTGGVDSRPGAVLLLLDEQAPTASVAARMSKASKGLIWRPP